jgi:squalene-hopene/tetraprenyl-beta-curcumene cyclase
MVWVLGPRETPAAIKHLLVNNHLPAAILSDFLVPADMSATVSPSRPDRLRATLDRVRGELLAERNAEGHWVGELASSALSTATAISAMTAVIKFAPAERKVDETFDEPTLRKLIRCGVEYLRGQQKQDGGFGDTDRSHSNIATSYLVLAASTLSDSIGEGALDPHDVERLNRYLDQAGRIEGLRRRYGKDKTFVVPIMNNMAIAGLISWDEVPALPFEAAVFPQSMYRFLQMPVVSYAIPALVAIGQARHFLGRRAWFPIRMVRAMSVGKTLRVLRRMQPESGGYLEATPLTAFVVMSLAATGRCDLSVVKDGLRFLDDSMRADGSWPIDTNLATWVTSLSIHALACDPQDDGSWYSDSLAEWHLGCQHKRRHPFTSAEPGGWGWTDLSGAVPDSDDTPAAILALAQMRSFADAGLRGRMDQAVDHGVRWLLRLQNRNGGWPTFCRGWGKLPFDRSSTDLTAHAIRAIAARMGQLQTEALGRRGAGTAEKSMVRACETATKRGQRFLRQQQTSAGGWLPLWFGNQDREDETNPVYGTAKVLIADCPDAAQEARAVDYLLRLQNQDGGWGGGESVVDKLREVVKRGERGVLESARGAEIPSLAISSFGDDLRSSVEETALAVEALATFGLRRRSAVGGEAGSSPRSGSQTSSEFLEFSELPEGVGKAIREGTEFLIASVEGNRHHFAWPIGFYFAKLWYHEQLYPLIFTVAALGKVLRLLESEHETDWPG